MEQIHDQPQRAARTAPRTPGRAPGPGSLLSASGRGLAPAHPMTPAAIMLLQRTVGNRAVTRLLAGHPGAPGPQRASTIQREIEETKLNIVGERHGESNARRAKEIRMVRDVFRFAPTQYWEEGEFSFTDATDGGAQTKHGDNPRLQALHSISQLATQANFLDYFAKMVRKQLDNPLSGEGIKSNVDEMFNAMQGATRAVISLDFELEDLEHSGAKDQTFINQARALSLVLGPALDESMGKIIVLRADIRGGTKKEQAAPNAEMLTELSISIEVWNELIAQFLEGQGYDLKALASTSAKEPSALEKLGEEITQDRSADMIIMAEEAGAAGVKGVWKVGEQHMRDLHSAQSPSVALTSREEFNIAYEVWDESKNKKVTAGDQG